MSELDKLRELLNEAGVSYLNHQTDVTIGYYSDDPHSVIEAMDHSLQVTGLTAEQVMRSLGAGTCRDVADTPQYGDKTRFECSECGYEYSAVGGFGCDYGDEPDFRFCPNCGRRIVGPTTNDADAEVTNG